MSATVLILFFAASSAAGYAAHYFSAEQKMIRTFKRIPVVPIQDATSGQEIRILGTVQVDAEEFVAPFTQRNCVYYEAIVEEQTDGSTWTEILRESRCTSFIVQDKTGRALVRNEKLNIKLHKDAEFTSGFLDDASASHEAFLARHGQKSVGRIFNRTLRYREGVFQRDEFIAVLGRIRWEHDPDPQQAGKGYRDVPKRAIMEPLESGEVWASDVVETWGQDALKK